MISEKTVFQIQNFKSQGRTQVWIARELQISRATVRGLSQFLWQDATKMGLSPSAGQCVRRLTFRRIVGVKAERRS
jgi:hypothetical protein